MGYYKKIVKYKLDKLFSMEKELKEKRLKQKISLPYLIYFLKSENIQYALDYIIRRYKYYRQTDISNNNEVLTKLTNYINIGVKTKTILTLKVLVYTIELYLNKGINLPSKRWNGFSKSKIS